MRKIIIFVGIILFFGVGFCLAQEEITITTYYPSPYGVYKNLRLYPTDDIDPTGACSDKGVMYYDDSDNQLYVCDGSAWQSSMGGVPSGAIMMWSGSIASIPAGWALCDGTGGTPDLRDKFVQGAPAGVNPGNTGGSLSKTTSGPSSTSLTWLAVAGVSSNTHTHDITDIRPPYYEIAFIMKL